MKTLARWTLAYGLFLIACGLAGYLSNLRRRRPAEQENSFNHESTRMNTKSGTEVSCSRVSAKAFFHSCEFVSTRGYISEIGFNYWFAVDLVNDTWRPLPRTKLLPREKWLFGDPFTSFLSEVRWNEPLCRFMISSVIAAQHNPGRNIQSVARRMVGSLNPTHLHWIVDLNGQQLLPELRYYGQCLSSEAPGSFLAAYWKGRKDRLW